MGTIIKKYLRGKDEYILDSEGKVYFKLLYGWHPSCDYPDKKALEDGIFLNEFKLVWSKPERKKFDTDEKPKWE